MNDPDFELKRPHVVAQYREVWGAGWVTPTDSWHLFVYDDGTYELDHRDKWNPYFFPKEHLAEDVLPYLLGKWGFPTQPDEAQQPVPADNPPPKEEEAPRAPQHKVKSIRLEGDSLSVGAGSPGRMLAAYLRAGGYEVDVSAQVGRHLSEVTARKGAELVLLDLGTNDLGGDIGALVARLSGLVAAELAAGASQVLYLTPPCFAPGVVGSWGGEMRGPAAELAKRAKAAGIPTVDVVSLSCDLTGAPWRRPDGIHFTDKGGVELGARMARAVAPYLMPLKAGVVYPLEEDAGVLLASSTKGATWQLKRFAKVYTVTGGALTIKANLFGPGTWNALLQHAAQSSLYSTFGPFDDADWWMIPGGGHRVEVETPVGEAREKLLVWQLYDRDRRVYLDPLVWAREQGALYPRSLLSRVLTGVVIGAGVLGAGYLGWKLWEAR